MSTVANLRRRTPEPPAGPPEVGLANETLGELAPLLAEEGPADSASRSPFRPGRWAGERAATDILALARKARAFGSLGTLLLRQRGKQVLYGALALTAPS